MYFWTDDLEQLIAIPALNSSGITENTTKENLTEMAEDYWKSLNAECTDTDCTGGSTIKTDALATMGEITGKHLL